MKSAVLVFPGINRERDMARALKLASVTVRYLQSYHFPGNVRELENMLERALAFSNGEVVNVEDLGLKPTVSDADENERAEPVGEPESHAAPAAAEALSAAFSSAFSVVALVALSAAASRFSEVFSSAAAVLSEAFSAGVLLLQAASEIRPAAAATTISFFIPVLPKGNNVRPARCRRGRVISGKRDLVKLFQ